MDSFKPKNIKNSISCLLLGASIGSFFNYDVLKREALKYEIIGMNEINSDGKYIYMKLCKSMHTQKNSDSRINVYLKNETDEKMEILTSPGLIVNLMSKAHKTEMIDTSFEGKYQYMRFPILETFKNNTIIGYDRRDKPVLVDKLPEDTNYKKKAKELHNKSVVFGVMGVVFGIGSLINFAFVN